jgi:hypothetical protein
MRKLEITGQKFNLLTAVKIDHKNKYGTYMWEFACECGVRKVTYAHLVRKGRIKSCGCLLHRTHCPYNKLPDGEAAFNALLQGYKDDAKRRELSFGLTPERFRTLTKSTCKYCGVPPLQSHNTHKNQGTPYVYNGIDRQDNKQGYTLENSVACCCVCNKAKRAMSVSQFMDWIQRLVKFHTNPESPAIEQGRE